jgi:dicarboxylate transporter 10
MTRASIVTACQCATYDEFKKWVFKNTSLGDGLANHTLSSTLAGLIATTATNPIGERKSASVCMCVCVCE